MARFGMARAQRLLAMLLLLALCLGNCSAPVYAFVEQPDNAQSPGQTQLDDLQDWGSALTPEGNLTLVDDVQTFGGSDKEFLTVQTRSGDYFYIIIEREGDKSKVHFLNQVDEADLLALLEDSPTEVEAKPPVCLCKGRDKCFIGSVNTACEVCAVDMQGCLGNEPKVAEPEAEKAPNPALAVAALLLLLAITGAGGWYLYNSFIAKQAAKQPTPDFDDEDNEDEEYLEDEMTEENKGDD